jgi:hypothetical protein
VTHNEAGLTEGPTISFWIAKIVLQKYPNCTLDALFGSHQTKGGGPEAAAFIFVVDTVVT